MEDNKKLLINLEGLQRYHENLKVVFDAAGSAAEAYEAAKEYVDGLNTALETALAAEATARTNEDTRLAGLIASETGTREGEMADMKDAYTAAIAAEATARTEADAAMAERVSKLEEIDHDELVADAIAAVVAGAESDFDTLKEVADWINSDTTGAAALQTTVSQHTESIAALETALAAETTARTEADAAITATVEANKTAIETALAAEATARTNEDGRLAGLIASEAGTREGEMADMKAAYTEAIAAEATARTDADAAITATVEANKTAIEAALAAEATARTNEDTRLAGLIASETGTREGEMADMKAAYIAADDEVRAYVDDKFVFATDADIDALFGDSDSY